MAKPNYSHMKKQREAARKARKQEKLERRSARAAPEEPATADSPVPDPERKESP